MLHVLPAATYGLRPAVNRSNTRAFRSPASGMYWRYPHPPPASLPLIPFGLAADGGSSYVHTAVRWSSFTSSSVCHCLSLTYSSYATPSLSSRSLTASNTTMLAACAANSPQQSVTTQPPVSLTAETTSPSDYLYLVPESRARLLVVLRLSLSLLSFSSPPPPSLCLFLCLVYYPTNTLSTFYSRSCEGRSMCTYGSRCCCYSPCYTAFAHQPRKYTHPLSRRVLTHPIHSVDDHYTRASSTRRRVHTCAYDIHGLCRFESNISRVLVHFSSNPQFLRAT